MTVERTGEIELLENMSRDFALKELLEGREERDRYPFAELDLDVFRQAEELGFFSLLSEEGGEGSNINDLGHVLKTLASEDASPATVIFVHSLAQMILIKAGRKELINKSSLKKKDAQNKQEQFPLIAFPCFELPEETARGLKARKKKDSYILSGKAGYVVLGGLAKQALLPAKIDEEEGYSFFLTSLEEQGVTVSPAVLGLGLCSCPAVDLTFSDAPVVLAGEPGQGDVFYDAAAKLLSSPAAAISLGVMKGAFRAALEYAQQRVQGGRKIIGWSEVRLILSRMALRCRSGEMLVSNALSGCERKELDWESAALTAALQVQEMACDVVSDGIQILGGNGYMKDYAQEKRFRDAHQLKVLLGHHTLRQLKYLEI